MVSKMPAKKEIEKLFAAKKARRLALAKLPFEKKIEILVQMQKLAADVSKTVKGIKRRPWKIS